MRTQTANTAVKRLSPPTWVLSLCLPSKKTLYYSTTAISIERYSTLYSVPLQPRPVLVGIGEFVEEIDLFGLDGSGTFSQVRVELSWDESLSYMQSNWEHITAATAEVSMLWDSDSWEDRIVLLSNATVQSLSLGAVNEPTTFVLESIPVSTSALIGTNTRDLGTLFPGAVDTAAQPMSDLTGRKPQYVFGAPLSVPGYKIGAVAGNNRLMLAGHVFPNTANVDVWEDGVYLGSYAVLNETAGGGAPYAYVQSAAKFLAADGAFTYAAQNGGIVCGDDTTRATTNAADIMRKLLLESGLRVDWRRMEPTFALLSTWRIGFYIDSAATAISLIRDKLVNYLPIFEMASGDGLWFAYSSPWSAPVEVELIVGQQLLGRLGRMEISDLETIENDFSVSYAYECFSSSYSATEGRDADTSHLCYLSQQLYGTRAASPIECNVFWSSTEAGKWCAARANLRALPRRIVSYAVSGDSYWLRAGMVVSITDDDFGISRARAVISSMRRSQEGLSLTAEFIDRTPTSRLV